MILNLWYKRLYTRPLYIFYRLCDKKAMILFTCASHHITFCDIYNTTGMSRENVFKTYYLMFNLAWIIYFRLEFVLRSTYESCLKAIINAYALCYPGCFRNARSVVRLPVYVIAIVKILNWSFAYNSRLYSVKSWIFFLSNCKVHSCFRFNYYDYVQSLHNYFLHW